jgi:hypothetical protein
MSTLSKGMRQVLDHKLTEMHAMTLRKWCATFPGIYSITFEWGQDYHIPCGLSSLDPWDGCSLMCRVHSIWFTFFFIYCVLRSGEELISPFDATMNFLSMGAQLFYTTCLVAGEARRWQYVHAFNPFSKRAAANFCNMGLCFCLMMEYMAICAEEDVDGKKTCFGETSREAFEGSTITFWMMGRVMQSLVFAAETPGVALLCRVCYKV